MKQTSSPSFARRDRPGPASGRARRGAWRTAATGLLVAIACHAQARAADTLTTELEQRLERDGMEAVNHHLVTHWDAAMLPFNRKVAACELAAVSLAIRLGRHPNERAQVAHVESLRVASGRCARFVLASVTPEEIPRYCAAGETWGPARMARELRRRISEIDADPLLRGSPRGQACRAAYDDEFRNTRVTLRALAPAGAKAGNKPTPAPE